MLDFNDAPPLRLVDPAEWSQRLERLRASLRDQAPSIIRELFPHARIQSHEARIGSLSGEPGESMAISLRPDNAGHWFDHATGEGGDFIDLWKATQGYSEFSKAVEELEVHCGLTRKPRWASPVHALIEKRKATAKREPPVEHRLGPPTASYHYYSADGVILGIVRRYELDQTDPATGKRKKTFLQFNAHGEAKSPDPRPLYRLPEIRGATTVVLVEGEKCADALAAVGIEATSAMGGAKALLEKIDFTPLAGKRVILWPDNDQAGHDFMKRVEPVLISLGCEIGYADPPPGKPDKWDAADAVAEGADIGAIIGPPTQAPPKPDVYRVLTIRELATLKPPEWRIGGIFPVYGSSTIYGAYESFKTFAALDMLLTVATGQPWLEHAVTRCPILYIAGEGQYGMAQRVLGWCHAKNRAQDPDNFWVLPEAIAIPSSGSLDKLLRTIDALPEPPGVIALDTITRMSGGGSLNDEKDMQQYVLGMDRLRLHAGCHVMNIGHSGKDRDKGLMGSTVLPAAMETIICVERRGDALTLVNTNPKGKQKDGPNFEDIHLRTELVRFNQAGELSSTLILTPNSVPDEAADDARHEAQSTGPRGANQLAIMAALRKANGQPLGLMRLAAMLKKDNTTVLQAVRPLIEKGLIHEVGEGGARRWTLA